MNLLQKIKILSKLGEILRAVGNNESWPGYQIGVNESEYESLVELTNRVHIYNGWFTPEAVKTAFLGISTCLNEEDLQKWISSYPIREHQPKTVALIMAGNIPLVGFHDFIAVFLSGNKSLVKLSSDDKHLFPAIAQLLATFDPEFDEWIEIKDFKLSGFDAVIATGSDNSANYFHSYFGKYPHIIRQNRTSIAVLDGSESKEELEALGEDIFTFFGLGCRNVSQVWLPEGFELNRLFDALYKFNGVVNHNKYANNYDYNKAIFLLNLEQLLDNGFILLKEDEKLTSPLGMLHYKYYSNKAEVENFIAANHSKIQVIIGHGYLPFGTAQQPSLSDFADGIDTLSFLTSL